MVALMRDPDVSSHPCARQLSNSRHHPPGRYPITTADTRKTIARYFDLMGRGIDFDVCCSADVTWLVADTGEVIDGARAVQDYVVALHASLTDMRTRQLVVGEDSAYLEGDCAAQEPGAVGRSHYCVAYDVRDDLIAAIRCYGIGG
jgi:ketosteroid isomerase-like protein